jgi:hypothetical protein
VEPPQSSRRVGRAFSPDWLHGQLENVRLEGPTYKNVIAVSLCESNSAAENLMNAKGRFDPEELLADARGAALIQAHCHGIGLILPILFPFCSQFGLADFHNHARRLSSPASVNAREINDLPAAEPGGAICLSSSNGGDRP